MRDNSIVAADTKEIHFCKDDDKSRTNYANDFLTEQYIVLLEGDAIPDHNLTFVSNQVAIFGLFLVRNMYNIISICGLPGLY